MEALLEALPDLDLPEPPPPSPPPPVLSSFDVDGIAEKLKDAQNVIVMTGAGLSVSAGIPDFRTPGTGLYDNLQKYDLPSPQHIFQIDYFKETPAPFYMLAKELFPGQFCPTPAHFFIKLLAEKKKLLRCFTQNIDSLEVVAGIDKDLVVAAHGNFDSATNIETGEKVNPDEVRDAILGGPAGWKAMVEKHGGLVKPDIVFFGESLPPRFFKHLEADFPKCDLLIVMGTSLVVQPFASLIDQVGSNIPRLLINREEVGVPSTLERMMMRMQHSTSGFEFEEDHRWRDVFYKGDCDDGVAALAAALGWADDFKAVVDAGRKHFEQSKTAMMGKSKVNVDSLAANIKEESITDDSGNYGDLKPIPDPPDHIPFQELPDPPTHVPSDLLPEIPDPPTHEPLPDPPTHVPDDVPGRASSRPFATGHFGGLWEGIRTDESQAASSGVRLDWSLVLKPDATITAFGAGYIRRTTADVPFMEYVSLIGESKPFIVDSGVKSADVILTETHYDGSTIEYIGVLHCEPTGPTTIEGSWRNKRDASDHGHFVCTLKPNSEDSQSGLWTGKATPAQVFSEVPVNPITWSMAYRPSASDGEPNFFGAGFFDDAGDIPGSPILFYTLQGSDETSFVKHYSAPAPDFLTVHYSQIEAVQMENGQIKLVGVWKNDLEGIHGSFEAVRQ